MMRMQSVRSSKHFSTKIDDSEQKRMDSVHVVLELEFASVHPLSLRDCGSERGLAWMAFSSPVSCLSV